MDSREPSVVNAIKVCQWFVNGFGLFNVMNKDGWKTYGHKIKPEYEFWLLTDKTQSRCEKQAAVINDFNAEFIHSKSVFEIAKTNPDLARRMCDYIIQLSQSNHYYDRRAADMLAVYFLRDEEHGFFPTPNSFRRDAVLSVNGKPATIAELVFLHNDESYFPFGSTRFQLASDALDAEINNSQKLTHTLGSQSQSYKETDCDNQTILENGSRQ